MSMHKLSSMILAGAVVLTTSFAQGGDGVTAPWPADWNNWSDPALWVTVGNPGNAADTQVMNDGTSGYGSVGVVGGSAYNIGKFEVTAGQYTAFLTAVAGVDTYTLYNTNMSNTSYGSGITRSGGGVVGNPYTYLVDSAFVNRPVNYVSFWDAARFTNWLQSGNTENGAYHDIGNQNSFGRNLDAKFFIPTENEWYKASYHDKTAGLAATYFDYPTSNNLAPGQNMADVSGNNANYYYTPPHVYPIDSPYCTTLAGEFQLSASPYGTFDQGGNVWEWNETAIGSTRGLRGGSFLDSVAYSLRASCRFNGNPTDEDLHYGGSIGFRVASVPEPGSLILIVSGAIGVLAWAWRRRRRSWLVATIILMVALTSSLLGQQMSFASMIANGDFENGLQGWTAYEGGGMVETVASYGDNISSAAHMYAHKDWTRGPGGGWGAGGPSEASLTQTVALEEGQTCVRFEAAATFTGCPFVVAWMRVYWVGGGSGDWRDIPLGSGNWQPYLVPVLDGQGNALTAGTLITITAESRLLPPDPGGAPEGQTEAHGTSNLYLDNFIMVPEPSTLVLLGIGAIGLLGYAWRRRWRV